MQAAGGRNLGRLMVVVSLPAVLGPILGPGARRSDPRAAYWSWMFWVNVPFCVAGLRDGRDRACPRTSPSVARRSTSSALPLLSPGLVGVLWGLSRRAGPAGSAAPTSLAPLAAGLVLLGAFVALGMRHRAAAPSSTCCCSSSGRSPRRRCCCSSPASPSTVRCCSCRSTSSSSAAPRARAGLLLIPQGLGTLAQPHAGRAALRHDRCTRWLAVAGFAIVALGTVPFAFAGAHTSVYCCSPRSWWCAASVSER